MIVNNRSDYIEQQSTVNKFNTGQSWSILSNVEQRIKSKVEEIGVPLKNWDISINRGILTGFNEAFIITGEKKEELIKQDPKSAEIIRPILRGRDIKRYEYEYANLYLICTFPSKKYNIDEYPSVKHHLLSYGYERLEQSGKSHLINGEKVISRKKTNNKWFETQDSISYWDDFNKQKIVWGEISDEPKFAIDDFGSFYLSNTVFFMIGESLLYLLGILNSKFSKYFFSQVGTTTGMGTVRWLKYKIETLPIPKLSMEEQVPISNLVKLIMENKKNLDGVNNLECQLDNKIYELFGFTSDEIKIIEQW